MEEMIICQSSNYGNFHILIFRTFVLCICFCLGEERGHQILAYVDEILPGILESYRGLSSE